jgi:hypothetical protein
MRRFKTLFLLLSTMLMLSTCAAPAYAYADETEENPPVTGGTETQPLTPEGNMTLVDDIDGEAGKDKQFIVVQSRAGHYFYIIIDRAAEGDNIVHFLNQVDEADLLSLIEQEEQAPAVCSCTVKCAPGAVNTACEVCAVNMAECVGPEPEPQEPDPPPDTPEAPEEPEKQSGNPLIIVALLAVLGAGGAVAYLKFFKKKPDTKGSADLDDYDYGDDDPEDEPEDDGDPDDDLEDE